MSKPLTDDEVAKLLASVGDLLMYLLVTEDLSAPARRRVEKMAVTVKGLGASRAHGEKSDEPTTGKAE